MAFSLASKAVHQKVLQLLYVDELLDSVRTTFCELVNPSGQHNPRQIDYTKLNGAAFAPAFQSLHDTIEAKHIALKSAPKTMRTFEQTEKGKQMAKDGKIKAKKKKKPAATSPALPDYEASESDEEIESGPSAEPNGTTTTTLPPVDSQELEEVRSHQTCIASPLLIHFSHNRANYSLRLQRLLRLHQLPTRAHHPRTVSCLKARRNVHVASLSSCRRRARVLVA